MVNEHTGFWEQGSPLSITSQRSVLWHLRWKNCSLNKHIATELTIDDRHTVTLSDIIAIVVIFNYETSITFHSHSSY